VSPEHRIELLRLTKPAVSNPDMKLWLAMAKELEQYVTGAGQPDANTAQARVGQEPAPPKTTLTLSPEARTTRPVAGPARK